MSEDAWIEHRTVATLVLVVRRGRGVRKIFERGISWIKQKYSTVKVGKNLHTHYGLTLSDYN
jgi:hypothetical protein